MLARLCPFARPSQPASPLWLKRKRKLFFKDLRTLSSSSTGSHSREMKWNRINMLEGSDVSIKPYLSSNSSCSPNARDALWMNREPAAHGISSVSSFRTWFLGAEVIKKAVSVEPSHSDYRPSKCHTIPNLLCPKYSSLGSRIWRLAMGCVQKLYNISHRKIKVDSST